MFIIDVSAGGLGGCLYALGVFGNLVTEDLFVMLYVMGIEMGVELDKVMVASLFIEKILGCELLLRHLKAVRCSIC